MSGGLTDRLLRFPLRVGMSAVHGMLRLRWFATRPQVRGAHAFALTPEGKLILVRLRYARGWRLPGGGVGAEEDAQAAVIRELREEIGLVAYGSIRLAFEDEFEVDFKRDRSNVFIVEGVRYAPRWSLEIETITECRPEAPPEGLSPLTARWLEQARPLLQRPGT